MGSREERVEKDFIFRKIALKPGSVSA